MLATQREDITIREMQPEDVVGYIRSAKQPEAIAKAQIAKLKKFLRERDETDDFFFVILYKGARVGAIKIAYTGEYTPDPEDTGFETDGKMYIMIPSYEKAQKIASKVFELIVDYWRETGFVDVLAVPRNKNGETCWEPLSKEPVHKEN